MKNLLDLLAWQGLHVHVRIQGLFPCGEGAGYAGGIVSAGVDGERCAEMCAKYMEQL